MNKKKIEKFVILGLIRSGTTYLTKLLDHNQNISAISDPYLHFFKSFRNEIYQRHLKNFDTNYPIDDCFCSVYKDLNQIIENSNLNEKIEKIKLSGILKDIKNQASRDSINVIRNLDKIQATNYSDLLIKLFDQIEANYNKQNLTHIGFKSTFVEQFTSTLNNDDNKLKFIFIIRDPRAVYASHINEHQKQYPLLFVIRNWRKSVYYALNKDTEYGKNSIYIKYEDLVKNKKNTLIKLFKFLNVDFKNYNFNTNKFKDDNGKNWISNSSFKNNNFEKSIDNWEAKLTEDQVKFIEYLTHNELKLLKYKTINKLPDRIDFDNFSNLENKEDFYEWIKDYSYKNYLINKKNLKSEVQRIEYLKDNQEITYDERKNFLIPNLFF